MNNILFIVTGSIAASKCKEIITLLRKKEVKISCILTKEAKKYIKISDIKKLLKNRIFTDEDEKFYKKLVDDAEEKNMWGQKQKKNIMILEPTDWNYKNVESRCDYEWEQNKK